MRQALNSFLFFLTTLLLIVHGGNSNPPVRTIYQFPLGTWVENLAVRANGNLLLTTSTGPDIYLVDPLRPNVSVLTYSFPQVLSTIGIAELSPDIFAVIVGNFSVGTGQATPDSFSVWRVDMGGIRISTKGELSGTPNSSKIADIPEAILPDGMTALPDSNGSVLISDIREGVIYRLDTRTATHEVVIINTLTNFGIDPYFGPAGVNGLKVHSRELFFTNTRKRLFARMPIHSDGTPAGNASIISRTPSPTDEYDDFALGTQGEAFLVTGSGNSVEVVTREGKGRIIAGNVNSTQIAEPTAAALGRGLTDKHVLYVVTGGGLVAPVNGNQKVGGQVVAISLQD